MNWLWALSTPKESEAERKARKWKQEAVGLLKALGKAERTIEKKRQKWIKTYREYKRKSEVIDESVREQIDRVVDMRKNAERLIDSHEEVEDALNSELRILRDVVVPQMALANESIRTQVEADIALQASRQAAYSPMDKGSSERGT